MHVCLANFDLLKLIQMTSLLTDFVKPHVEKLIDGALSETRYVCCFTSIAKEFKEEQTTLEAERITVGQRINVASRSGNDIAAHSRRHRNKQEVFFWILSQLCMAI